MKTTTVRPIIDLFKVCPTESSFNYADIRKLSILKSAMAKGYIIHPACINEYSEAFIGSIDMQYNSTFYTTWMDVTNKDRLELFIDQIIHYFTSNMDNQYVPNCEPSEPAWNTYKTILPCTMEDLFNKCIHMLQCGIALKSQTVKDVTDFIIEYWRETNVSIDIDRIANREALVILCDTMCIYPNDDAKLFAHIMYKTTGLTMIVKNRETRKCIQRNRENSVKIWTALTEKQKIALAGIFNRYKMLFLEFKGFNGKVTTIINQIGRLSKKHHKPMKRGFWETVLTTNVSLDEISRKACTATNYKLIQVMQSIRERLIMASGFGDNMYVIRNGKVFVKENDYNAVDSRYFYWEDIYKICKQQLVLNLSKKACVVKFPKKFELMCPTSEKNFIGDIPMGTSCELGENTIFGIYWKEDWGTRDFDLSYQDINGNRIGWNAGYYNNDGSIIYSGDMTRAPKGANECIYIKKDAPDGIVYVNRYNGETNSKYRLFFGHDAGFKGFNGDMTKPYMTDRNKISIESEVVQGDSSQQMVGAIFDNKMHFFELSCGYTKVAHAIAVANRSKNKTKNWDTTALVDMLKKKVYSAIPIKEILLEAGFTDVTTLKNTEPDLDLTVLSRDTLIDLFDKYTTDDED